MSQIIFRFKPQYILKSIFSVVNFGRTLKIINKNRQLQTNLGLNIINYKKRSSYQYVTKQKLIREIYNNVENKLFGQLLKYGISAIITITIFIFILIDASILVAKGAFNGNNTKENYNKNIAKIIDKINISLFGFLGYVIVSYIFIYFWVTNNCNTDYGIIKLVKKMVLIIFWILCHFYDILIIIKLALSYKIKKNKITWFMRCDYVLIIFISLYLAGIIFNIYVYFANAGKSVSDEKVVFLTKFRDIKIYDFPLPLTFIKLNEYEKRKFILNNKNKYEILISREQYDLIYLINYFRRSNNINEFIFDDIIKFDDLIIDKYSEVIFCVHENIFKLSNENYLLKYPLSEFKTKYNKDKNITNFLSNKILNSIIIIEMDKIQYINVFYSKRFNLTNINEKEQSERIRIRNIVNTNRYYYKDEKYYES